MDSARLLYENQYIGAFIYALGVVSGRRNQGDIGAFSLLQQTPADAGLADMLAQWSGRCFLWEFKRDRSEIREEARKPAKNKVLTELLKDKNRTQKLTGDQCHFLACGKETTAQCGRTVDLEFFPYSLALAPQEASALSWPMSLEGFVKNIVSADGEAPGKLGVDVGSFDEYVAFLQRCTGYPPGVNGVVVKIDGKGKAMLVRFDGLEALRDIAKTMATGISRRRELGAPSQEPGEARVRRPARGRDRGPEIGG